MEYQYKKRKVAERWSAEQGDVVIAIYKWKSASDYTWNVHIPHEDDIDMGRADTLDEAKERAEEALIEYRAKYAPTPLDGPGSGTPGNGCC